jgi:RNA polymerase sigma-70 factor, ECF subfamily
MGCDWGKIMHTLTERPLVISRASEVGSGQGTSDEALIGAIAAGDQRALQVLYARHHVRVYRFVLRLTQDRSLAEDLVSDVFIDVWRRAGSFKGKSQVSTWVLAIARYKALSALRAHSDAQLDDNAAASIVDPTDDAETMMSKRDRSATIQKCLAQLSPNHREVLDLVYYHERSVDEVAEIVGVPLITVKTRMFYARKRMENLLEASGLSWH